jgi:Tol biopolymer transport system component/DNA-binding winged helix-turn-helix (wHTH) protein
MSFIVSYFYKFGDFAVDLDQRVLLRGDKPVPLTPKVFDTLLVLVEQHGRLVTKDELMSRLWPDSFVEETNLTFNVLQLRRALGDNARKPIYIETVARRGYRFKAEIEEVLSDARAVDVHVSVQSHTAEDEAGNGFAAGRAELQPEFGVASQSQLNGAGVTRAISPPTSLRPARRSAFIFAAVALLLMGAVVSVWYLLAKRNQNRRHTISGTRPGNPRPLKLERLTETGKSRYGVISPDGEYFAYTVEAKGRYGIWLRELATGAGREIVSLSERLGGLTFDHNGKNVYFVKGNADAVALYRVALPMGGMPVKLVEKPEGTFSLSPDDSRIAFLRYSDDDKECALMISETDGSHERTVVKHPQPDRFNAPSWSPDGNAIVVAVGPSDSGTEQVRIVEFNVSDGTGKELSSDRWFHVSRLVWLPDHSGLLIVGARKFGASKQIWRMSYPGGELSQLTDGATAYADVSITRDAGKAVAPQMTLSSNIWIGPAAAPPHLNRVTHAADDFCWTRNGRIVFASYESTKLDLWVMQLDGTERTRLTNAGERNATPSMTQDGRYIVFSSNRSGRLQIWRMDADGSNAVQLTSSTAANFPSVSPDGRWIVYNIVDDWSLWKVSINGGQPARLVAGRAVYPSVSPDGKSIAFLRKDARDSRKIAIISSASGQTLREFDLGSLKLSARRLEWSADGGALFYAAAPGGVAAIYRQSLSGGPPEKMMELIEDDIFDFGYSPDGQQLAVTRGDWQFDVVLVNGLNQ